MSNTVQIDEQIQNRAKSWLSEMYDPATRAEVQSMLDSDPENLVDSFYKDLEFGTGGLRGIMGAGTNKMNIYTLGMATQGLSNYLKKCFSGNKIKVAIAHDCRNNSRLFAETAAAVFSANDIEVFLFEDLRPTPELSFAIRELNCHAGIVLTASHNPKEYNGYKVYWNDGGQLIPPHDKNTINEVRQITSPAQVKFEAKQEFIHEIGKEIDEKYHNRIAGLSLYGGGRDKVKIVFTPIHGTGIKGVPQVLKKMGFKNVSIVPEQEKPDGNFPTVHSPNPEENAALALAIRQAEESGADLVMGTDPDSDRVGLAVKDSTGKMQLLNGNEAAVILVWYVLNRYATTGKLKGNEFVAKTIVTTGLISNIAESHGVECLDCLTGFKYIAGLIKENEGKKKYLAGGEESYGYLVGDFVRDKDAVSSAAMLAEAAAWAKDQEKSLLDLLKDIHCQYGLFKETLISLTKKGKSGAEEIQQMMSDFRQNAPEEINGSKVMLTLDYAESLVTDQTTGTAGIIALPKSDVFQFVLMDGSIITARPSGTEPKIKFYISVRSEVNAGNYEAKQAELQERIKGIKEDLKLG